jgi:hypothetical protein
MDHLCIVKENLYIYFFVNAKSFLLMSHTEAGQHPQRFLCHVRDRLDPKGRAQQNWSMFVILSELGPGNRMLWNFFLF